MRLLSGKFPYYVKWTLFTTDILRYQSRKNHRYKNTNAGSIPWSVSSHSNKWAHAQYGMQPSLMLFIPLVLWSSGQCGSAKNCSSLHGHLRLAPNRVSAQRTRNTKKRYKNGSIPLFMTTVLGTVLYFISQRRDGGGKRKRHWRITDAAGVSWWVLSSVRG